MCTHTLGAVFTTVFADLGTGGEIILGRGFPAEQERLTTKRTVQFFEHVSMSNLKPYGKDSLLDSTVLRLLVFIYMEK